MAVHLMVSIQLSIIYNSHYGQPAGSDYNSNSEMATFSSGQTTGDLYEFIVNIIDDAALEGNQSFTIKITSNDPGVVISCGSTVVTIFEDPTDCKL